MIPWAVLNNFKVIKLRNQLNYRDILNFILIQYSFYFERNI